MIYYGYGFQFNSNIPLLGLGEQRPEEYAECYVDVDIAVSIQTNVDFVNNQYGIVHKGTGYVLYLQDIIYHIKKSGITATGKYLELFYSMLYRLLAMSDTASARILTF